MDYTKVDKDLIFIDRKSLFDYFNRNELLSIIVENMGCVRPLLTPDFEKHMLACLNMAYYICTISIMEFRPIWRFEDYRLMLDKNLRFNELERYTVFFLVAILLRHYNKQWQKKNENFILEIENYLKSYVFCHLYITNDQRDEICDNLRKGTEKYITLPDDEFAPRSIVDESIQDYLLINNLEYVIDVIERLPPSDLKLRTIDLIEKKTFPKIAIIVKKSDTSVYFKNTCIDFRMRLGRLKNEVKEECQNEPEIQNSAPSSRVSLQKNKGEYCEECQFKQKETDLQTALIDKEKRIKELQDEIEELRRPIKKLNPKDKVRMKLALQLLYKAGLTDESLKVYGNKQKAAVVMSLLLNIVSDNAKGNTAQTCATFISAGEKLSSRHQDDVNKINDLLSGLGIDIQLNLD